jgi:uncharacterized protein (TIGR02145 family)
LGERVITSTPTDDQTYYFNYTNQPCTGNSVITDIEGNTYNTVQIGDQCWMKENLKTTRYKNGTPIPIVTDSTEWLETASGAYTWYENNSAWKDLYGALYNGYTTTDPNGLCPGSWHVPTSDEWLALKTYIGGGIPPHGDELKSCRQINSPLGGNCNTSVHPRWNDYEYNDNYGSDLYGFSGLPGGFRDFESIFHYIGTGAIWWASTEISPESGWTFGIDYGSGGIVTAYDVNKKDGFSIRCLRDYYILNFD